MKNWIILAAATLLVAACATTTAPPAPTATPIGDDRYLIDPRTGWPGSATPAVEQRFNEAWRFFLAGNEAEARRRLSELRAKNPEYTPAAIAESAIAIRNTDYDVALAILGRVLSDYPSYTAARVYEAEIATRQKRTRRAIELYREVVKLPGAPLFAQERLTALETDLFNELFTAGQQAAAAEESARLLREALAVNPGATAARMLLVQRLVAAKSFDEARRELDPLLNTGEVDSPQVQEALAEIDAGRGRYQEAIVRFDRLARRTRDERYTRRLTEIKEAFSAANMPPHVQRALGTAAITRADLATLLYWNVNAVRFAQNIGTPQIAVDIGDVEGREEMIRAIAIGLYEVDPVTRRVGPHRNVTAATFARQLARLLTLRGASCARGATDAGKVLSACNITTPTAADPDALVSGGDAVKAIRQVDAALR